jgi:ubiquinone/menaquinone biosynthesis C-methylase UbiE
MNVDGLAFALGLGAARGAKALAKAVPGEKQRVVVFSDVMARALHQAGHTPVPAAVEDGRLPLADAAADALCASGLPDAAITPAALRECARVVRTGGRVLVATAAGIVGRGPERFLLTALFLHAGMIDIQQQLVRGTAITSGLVRR